MRARMGRVGTDPHLLGGAVLNPSDPMHPENRETLDLEPEDRRRAIPLIDGDDGWPVRPAGTSLDEWDVTWRGIAADYWREHYAANPPEGEAF